MLRFWGSVLGGVVAAMHTGVYAACPDGYTEYLGGTASENSAQNANGDCVELCDAGITSLKTSNGYIFDLFAGKNTDHAIAVMYNNVLCYADLVPGHESGTMNIGMDGAVYHTFKSAGNGMCVAGYKLSYECGDGATGTPPAAIDIAYGELYTPPYDAGTCNKPGYSISGWKIDSTSLEKGRYYNYLYSENKSMVAQYAPNIYCAPYLCNNGTVSDSYLSANFGATATPETNVCTAATGATFAGWRILDVFGNATGDVVAPGASFTWRYPGNIQLQAIWE